MVTAADLRALVARHQAKLYELAPRVGLHPTRLGRLLNEREAMPPGFAERIAAALRELSATVTLGEPRER